MIAAAAAVSVLKRNLALLGSVLFFAGAMAVAAEEPSLEQLPGLREKAVVMRIVSRIVEQNQQVVWNEETVKLTFPGRPVGLKLVGADLVVAVQFTPFLRASGRHVLVAQGQIWTNAPEEGVSYHMTMQTIPLEFNEQVYFFPLGPMKAEGEAQIEIQLVVEPYSGNSGDVGGPENPRGGRPDSNRGEPDSADGDRAMRRAAPDEKDKP